MPSPSFDVATITLNPALDRTLAIPNFTAGGVNRVQSLREMPGGKGVNVASALADSGYRTAVAGFLGRENAAAFETLFVCQKIADHFVRIPGATRVGIKIFDPARKQTTDINFPGLAPGPADVASLRDAIGTLQSRRWVIAGSLPPGLDPSVVRDLVAELKSRRGFIVLDTSGAALRAAVEAGPTIIKPNRHELEELTGRRLDGPPAILDAARTLLAKGIEMVVVSMGRHGACFVTTSGALLARSPDVDVRSTVGAGDAMVAGIVAARILALPPDAAARLASAYSFHALTRDDPERFSHPALEKTMSRITIEPIP